MDGATQIMAILLATAIANVAFAALLWRRHGFIRQVMVLLVLSAVLLFNAVLWKVRHGGATGWDSAVASSPR